MKDHCSENTPLITKRLKKLQKMFMGEHSRTFSQENGVFRPFVKIQYCLDGMLLVSTDNNLRIKQNILRMSLKFQIVRHFRNHKVQCLRLKNYNSDPNQMDLFKENTKTAYNLPSTFWIL
jgi:hypothetical protein